MEDREQNNESLQVNVELSGMTAEAFRRYRDSLGLSNNAPAGRSLIVQQLRAAGYLPSTEPLREQSAVAA